MKNLIFRLALISGVILTVGCSDFKNPDPTSTSASGASLNVDGTAKALSVSLSGTGTGKVTGGLITCVSTDLSACTAFVANNSIVTLKAEPATGSVFAGWSGDCSGTQTTCTLSMGAARSVVAIFSKTTSAPTCQLSFSSATVQNNGTLAQNTITATRSGTAVGQFMWSSNGTAFSRESRLEGASPATLSLDYTGKPAGSYTIAAKMVTSSGDVLCTVSPSVIVVSSISTNSGNCQISFSKSQVYNNGTSDENSMIVTRTGSALGQFQWAYNGGAYTRDSRFEGQNPPPVTFDYTGVAAGTYAVSAKVVTSQGDVACTVSPQSFVVASKPSGSCTIYFSKSTVYNNGTAEENSVVVTRIGTAVGQLYWSSDGGTLEPQAGLEQPGQITLDFTDVSVGTYDISAAVVSNSGASVSCLVQPGSLSVEAL